MDTEASGQTEMTEKLPSYEQTEDALSNDNDPDSILTPEPNSPNADRENLSPKSASNHLDDNEEEKDSLYDVLAPKQSIKGQLNEVVDNIPDQNNIVVASDDETEDGDKPLAYHHPQRSMDLASSREDHYNLKSTLKKDQRAWVDPWEAAVQDTFYHKEIKDLRPTFEVVTSTIKGVESLRNLFAQQPATIAEDNEYDENPDDYELELEEKAMAEEPKGQKKFGPWDGVMAGCLLNIFGVIMFLRVGFVVGQAGIIGALIIMSISSVVTILTALSMSAICTNGTILAGGAYYIISRALGPSVGGAIGILFSLGNMCACSLYLIGFAETMVKNLDEYLDFHIFSDPVNDVRIW
eukprot:CAMPEP_0201592910 /NCGR_PEP_ID=MMETSP0190_2-20130828/190665_1 /ASSEMBLY_ACC=CAM_ASM_000263 /TAXON_ID=37353 /ORGANISM="Rosalina sp." /LENGTH=351 /DNA_ID=CAMNT_0048051875 /DNA_START=61 /DNA_END=1113 /DNA_ORIENTATION=+